MGKVIKATVDRAYECIMDAMITEEHQDEQWSKGDTAMLAVKKMVGLSKIEYYKAPLVKDDTQQDIIVRKASNYDALDAEIEEYVVACSEKGEEADKEHIGEITARHLGYIE